MNRLLFTFMFVILFSTVYCQSVTVNIRYLPKHSTPKSDTIFYQSSTRLTWKDFKGTPPLHSVAGAITASGFAYNADMHFSDENHIILDVDVYCYFTKHDSWKKSDINSAYHLEHEQHHFDITYLGALNFIKEVNKAHFTSKNYNHLLASIFNSTYEKNTELQHQYDSETKNSINKEEQEAWNKKIASMLETELITRSE